jgi:hypothetical protein
MSTSAHVNTHAHAVTHVATGLITGLRRVVKESGLDPALMHSNWPVLEAGTAAWLASGHLKALVLEVFDPRRPSGSNLVGRFDYTIDYGYYPGGDGELWIDPDAVFYAVLKAGVRPSQCSYRFVADTTAGRPEVAGWSSTTFRSTAAFTRHSIGTAIGGGSLGAGLSYYSRTGT